MAKKQNFFEDARQAVYDHTQPVRDFFSGAAQTILGAFSPEVASGGDYAAGPSLPDRPRPLAVPATPQQARQSFAQSGPSGGAADVGKVAGAFINAVNPVMRAVQLGNALSDSHSLADAGRAVGNFGIQSATGIGKIKALNAAKPLPRLLGYSALRGAENVASGQASSIVNTGSADLSRAGNDFALGAVGNAALSPRLTARAGGQLAKGTVRLANAPGLARMQATHAAEIPLMAAPNPELQVQGAQVRDYSRPETVEQPVPHDVRTYSLNDFRDHQLYGKALPATTVKQYGEKTVTAAVDPQGRILSWNSDDPQFLARYGDPKVLRPGEPTPADYAAGQAMKDRVAATPFTETPNLERAQFRSKPLIRNIAPLEDVSQPTGKTRQRGFVTNVNESPRSDPELAAGAKGSYDRIGIEGTMENAAQLVEENPDRALQQLTSERKYDASTSAVGQALMEHYQRKGEYEQALNVFDQIKVKATESGQANAMLAYWNRLSPEGVLRYAAREVDRASQGKVRLSPEKAAVIRAKAEEAAQATDPAEMARLKADTVQEIEKAIPTAGGRKLMTLIKAGFLSGAKTHVRNFVGNATNSAAEGVSKLVGSGIDSLISAIGGTKRTLSATLQGAGEGAAEGLQSAKSIMKSGYDFRNPPAGVRANAVNWGDSVGGKAAKLYTDTVFNLLEAGDKPFYYSALKNSLYEQAKVAAINAGRRGDQAFIKGLVASPNPDMVRNSVIDAERSTFKNRTGIGAALSSAKQEIRRQTTKYAGATLGNAAGDVADYLLPFTQVPSSAASQALAYSPVGIVQTLIKNIRKGELDQRDLSMSLGRGLTGTALAAVGAELAKENLISFAYPTDAREQAQWREENRQAYSVKLGGKWVPLSVLGPQAQGIITGAAAQAKGAGFALATAGRQQADQPMLQGTTALTDALSDPARYGEGVLKSAASGLVPTLIGDVAKATDMGPSGLGVARETNNALDAVKAKIPVLRGGLLPQRGAFGEELSTGRGPVDTLVNPFNPTQASTDPTVLELRRLLDAGSAATPTKVPAVEKALGQTVRLDPGQLDQFEQAIGPETLAQFKRAMESPAYQAMSDDDKAKLLNNITSDVRQAGKKNLAYAQSQGQPLPESVIGITAHAGAAPSTAFSSGSSKPSQEAPKAPTASDRALARYEVENGLKDSVDLGTVVVRTNPSTGQVEEVSRAKVAGTAKAAQRKLQIQQAKAEGDYGTWENLTLRNLASLMVENQRLDPELDGAKIAENQGTIESSLASIRKYRGYGGFAKPKKPKKARTIPRISAPRGGRSAPRGGRLAPRPAIRNIRVRGR